MNTIPEAIAAIAAGRPVVVADDADRENEGDLIFAAEFASPGLMGFAVRHTSGVLCAALPGADCDRLGLPPMVADNQDRKGTAFTVSVDAAEGITTGISAAERAHTVRLLADPEATAADLSRPGHIFPLRAAEGGVLQRRGHTEAAVDLARLAGAHPVGVLSELVNDDGSMMRMPELEAFAAEHDLVLITVADLVEYRMNRDRVERVAEAALPTRYGTFRGIAFRDGRTGEEHLVAAMGELEGADDLLVRIHSECLTGEAFGSLRCDCGPQLDAALAAVAAAGRGAVVYLRGQEGRGIGLANKLKAYELQDAGADTVEANLALGLPSDARDYRVGAQILQELGVRDVRLLTNNPDKVQALERYGVPVRSRQPLSVGATVHNARYLQTKRDRMNHEFGGVSVA
ncbi:MAG TPA: bifunctional 3,4-dihydroxy-2-butanone-4-phosphate synthase/GTP cyclohydrolase II [Mycobacteriales bacterium]|nr:bifunctional 3,4-dihydroxy-2-butanone-4-phosphate synthase/GTP cyclohydrolase II [Mycobacteriales bacterium]